MADENQDPKKGYAAPLEGVVGREIMAVLNLAFAMIGFNMIQGLGMQATAKLGVGGPSAIAGKPGIAATPAVASPTNPMSNFAGPKFNNDTTH